VDARFSDAGRRRAARPAHRSLPWLAALLAVLVAACSGAAATPTPAPTAVPTQAPTQAPTATPAPSPVAAFPVTLTDDEGTKVTIQREPQKIVALTPAATETLFALGLGDRVVGKAQDVDLYPPEAGPIPEVAVYDNVDVEKVTALQPDLVIAGGNNFIAPDSIARLRSLGLPVVVIYAPDTRTVFHDLELTGQAVGRAAEAEALAGELRAGFDAVAAATKGLDTPRVFYEIDATGAIYGPADDSFLAEMIQLAGGDPVTTGSPDKFDIPLERLIEADPEVILLGDAAYGTTPDHVASRQGWQDITAVKTGATRPVNDLVITRPGPRLLDGLRALAQAIHPDLSLGADASPSASAAAASASAPAPSASAAASGG